MNVNVMRKCRLGRVQQYSILNGCFIGNLCIPSAFLHRVTLQWERWWMPRLAPSQRWHSTSQHCCGDNALPPNVMKRSLKQRSPGPCLGVYCSYLWVPERDKWAHVYTSVNTFSLWRLSRHPFYYQIKVWNLVDRCSYSCINLLLTVCLWTAQGICMIIGGIKHREQRFNSRSAGVSSALLFISIGGMSGSCTYNVFCFCFLKQCVQ